ncbi:WG repeat-containing protein [bacterium SCSIO 12643]|nr:WG repeat-containing protein [bacterium SCSIO 12643]
MIKYILILIFWSTSFGLWAQTDDPILIPFRDCKQWYYVNEKGERVGDQVYDFAEPFTRLYAAIMINGKYGFIDQNQKIIIEPQYDYATTRFGVLTVVLDGNTFRVNRDNTRDNRVGCGTRDFMPSTMKEIFKKDNKMGVLDEYRDTLVPPIYKKIEIPYSTEAIIVYTEEGKIGIYNNYGKMIFPAEQDSIEIVSEYVIKVGKEGKYGAVNRLGRLIVRQKYDNLHFDYFNMPYTINEKGRKGYIYKGKEYWSDCKCFLKK